MPKRANVAMKKCGYNKKNLVVLDLSFISYCSNDVIR
jgi:hypothetical protein